MLPSLDWLTEACSTHAKVPHSLMTIPAKLVPLHPDFKAEMFQLRRQDGTLVANIDGDEGRAMVLAEVVYGIGSKNRLRFLRLEVASLGEARRIVAAHGESRHRAAARDQSVLMKTVAARKFVVREHLTVKCEVTGMAEKTGLWTWAHRRGMAVSQ